VIRSGRVSIFVFFVLFAYLGYMAMSRFKKSQDLPIRRLAGLDAIDEAVGRITEMGRPAAFVFGNGTLEAQWFAAFDILRYCSRETAKYNAEMIVCNPLAEVQPVVEEVVRGAYIAEGKPQDYNPDNVRYLSDTGLRAAVLGIFGREKVAANFMFGNYYHESVIFAEAGNAVGAIQISGTANTHQIPFFVASCDYTLLGEEIFAAGTYLSRDPAQVGSLVAQEYAKYFAVVIMIIGTIMSTMGSKALDQILGR